jgi:hypothetical protein
MFVAPAPGFIFQNPISMFHDPVPVFPSTAQIREGTRNVTFSSLENPVNETCPISLNDFQPLELVTQIRGCGHIFGRTLIWNWFLSSCCCPVCRFDIRTYVAADNINTFDDENADAVGEYETTFSQNATAIFNLLSNPTSGGAVVRDLSGNNFMVHSFYDT